jgi:zinc/manganese transport system ATP-binding protein
MVVVAKQLAAGYRDKPVWRDASFSIKRGEFIGLLGPNGAGKTTLLNLILGLRKPLDGELLVFGERPKKGSQRIGYVPQRHQIDSESRIEALEYVRLGVSRVRLGFSWRAQAENERQAALSTLELVGGTELATKALSQLSGGELQKIFLAQALAGHPDLLLLDEPLSNLDIRHSQELLRLVKSVSVDKHLTVVLIAHDINPLLPVVDRIIYIANQKIASGTLAEVVTSQSLSALYSAPIEVVSDSRGRLAVLGTEEVPHHEI